MRFDAADYPVGSSNPASFLKSQSAVRCTRYTHGNLDSIVLNKEDYVRSYRFSGNSGFQIAFQIKQGEDRGVSGLGSGYDIAMQLTLPWSI